MKPRMRAHLVPFGPFVTFAPKGNWSEKVRCSACGASGYPGCKWEWTHLRGHKPCGRCGRMMVVRLNGQTRVHTRCPA